MSENEWQDYLRRMDEHEHLIRSWQPEDPNPAAGRCVGSRHRTLAHLRACQESWLEACIAFDRKPDPRLKMLHPWRLFEQRSYELVSWSDHLAAYLDDRGRWKQLLNSADRRKSGRINDREHSIESLTERLVDHERHHLFTPR